MGGETEFEQDWSVGLGATLGADRKFKKYFSSYKDFSEKTDSAMFLGFECTINPQNLMKIVGAFFEKMKILNFFLCELPFILRVGQKWKGLVGDNCKTTLNIEFEQDWSVGLGVTLGDG